MACTTTRYQGVLCLQMSYVLFYGEHLNVTSFAPIRNVRLLDAEFHDIVLSTRQLYLHCLIPNFSKTGECAWKIG